MFHQLFFHGRLLSDVTHEKSSVHSKVLPTTTMFYLQLLGVVLAVFMVAESHSAVTSKPRVVRDLAYGEALYYFYQGDYFSSITRLQVAQHHDLLKHHREDAGILLGGLFLSYGLHNEAANIFERLLDQNADVAVRNRARLYLAKIWYQRGYLDKAERALSNIQDQGLPPEVTSERHLLLTYIYMSQGRYSEAVDILGSWKKSDDLGMYSQYNLGVSLVRSGQIDKGFELLGELGLMPAENSEMRALRDKANLALGYTYLQQEQPELARTYLERIQLDGLASGKALLGIGWAELSLGNYKKALKPWAALSRRNTIDSSVQEAQLAIPYALANLKAEKQAIQYYHKAIDLFQSESVQLKNLQDKFIQDGVAEDFLHSDTIDSTRSPEGMGWYWRLDDLPAGPESRYLYQLLSQHEFQEVLKNYRDLKLLQRNLDSWASSIDAFEDMLVLRRDTYNARVPRIQESSQGFDLEEAKKKRDDYLKRLTGIEQRNNVAGLATAKEIDLESRLRIIDKIITEYNSGNTLSSEGVTGQQDEIFSAQREKQRLLKGVLLWQEDQEFKARLWRTRKNLRQLDQQIGAAEAGRKSIFNAQRIAPQGFEGFDRKITAQRDQVRYLQARIEKSKTNQGMYMQNLVLTELGRRQKRLDEYLAQARYGLARVFDLTATREDGTP